MEFLQRYEDRGYPTEYLVSRIRGRRAYFLEEWNSILSSPDLFAYLLKTPYGEFITEHHGEGVWKRLLKEYKWIYLQMNKHLRNVFHVFFQFTEMKTVIVCLRHKISTESTTRLTDILSLSLLSEKMKEILDMETDFPSMLHTLERDFLFPPDEPARLKDVFLEEGLKGVEEGLIREFLQGIMRLKLHPVIKSFFTSVIDSKNIIALYKHLRWGIKVPPLFIRGGSISEAHLTMVIHTNAISEVPKLIYRLTGLEIEEPTASNLEKTLLISLTKNIKAMSRRSTDIGLILDYLWRYAVEVQNLSLLLYCGDIERDILKEELVM